MQRNGIRLRGLIDQFESIEIDVRKACEIVGDELVKKGLFEDAVKLYDLAGVSGFLLSSPWKSIEVSTDIILNSF